MFQVTQLLICLDPAWNQPLVNLLSCCATFQTWRIRYGMLFNPFPHDKSLDQTKLNADHKLNVTKMIISVFDREENIAGKGGIACTSNFSFSHNNFKRLLSQTRQKVSLCGNG